MSPPPIMTPADSPESSAGPPKVTKRKRGDEQEASPALRRPELSHILSIGRPLVALLDGRDCSVEMPILKGVAIVSFCDAKRISELHDVVFSDAFGVFVWHSINLDKAALEKFQKLKLIIRLGSGVDNVDCQAAGERGIAVCHLPGFGVEEVADTTMCHILTLFRRTFWLAKTVSTGRRFQNYETAYALAKNCGRLYGNTLGIVGLGRVGIAVACRAKAFGMNVIFYDPYLPDRIERSHQLTRVFSLGELLSQSNCVSLHCNLDEHNKHMINHFTLKQMKPGSYLVNTARGGLVDEAALAHGLKSGHLLGAALDVFEGEPFDIRSSPLRDAPNLVCTPHTAWYSEQASIELREMAALEMKRAIMGGVPHDLRNCVNKHYFPTTSMAGPLTSPLLVTTPPHSLGIPPTNSPLVIARTTTPEVSVTSGTIATMATTMATTPASVASNLLLMQAAASQVSANQAVSQATEINQLPMTNRSTIANPLGGTNQATISNRFGIKNQVDLANKMFLTKHTDLPHLANMSTPDLATLLGMPSPMDTASLIAMLNLPGQATRPDALGQQSPMESIKDEADDDLPIYTID